MNDNELTLLAWLRTAISLWVVGCALALLGRYLEQDGRAAGGTVATNCAAVVLLFVGTVAVLLGLGDYHRRRRAGDYA